MFQEAWDHTLKERHKFGKVYTCSVESCGTGIMERRVHERAAWSHWQGQHHKPEAPRLARGDMVQSQVLPWEGPG